VCCELSVDGKKGIPDVSQADTNTLVAMMPIVSGIDAERMMRSFQ
jgi:hypothetical protein